MSARPLLPLDALRLAIGSYALDPFGIHGLGHWGRVLENGLRLAESTHADRFVVCLFAVLHDCRRWNEGTDRGHGLRASALVQELVAVVPELTSERAELLRIACAHHTDGELHDDPTVATCWDADRLDLARVGIRPSPTLLCTPAARVHDQIEAATRRAVAGVIPSFVRNEWADFIATDPADRAG